MNYSLYLRLPPLITKLLFAPEHVIAVIAIAVTAMSNTATVTHATLQDAQHAASTMTPMPTTRAA